MKSHSDKSFFEFIGSRGSSPVLLIIILAVALLIFAGMGKEEQDAKNSSDETAELCSMVSGVGECRVMITYGNESEVYAVAILCQGAESPSVRSDLTELICSLYGIGAHRVSILPLR